jgi:hypothetical protein
MFSITFWRLNRKPVSCALTPGFLFNSGRSFSVPQSVVIAVFAKISASLLVVIPGSRYARPGMTGVAGTFPAPNRCFVKPELLMQIKVI